MTDYQIAISGLETIFLDTDVLIQSFKKAAYPPAFQKFYLKQVPVFDAIENLYSTVVDKDTMLENMAEAVASHAQDLLDKEGRRNRETLRINISLVMAGFIFPSILKYGGSSSQPLIEAIQKKWKEHFPKMNISAAPFDDIEAGFHRKWCYITTAACQYRGMEDDCEELNLLRDYRDTYMAGLREGDRVILDYYDIAPSIVKHINMRPDADLIYDGIWEKYIGPCILLIREGKMEECMNLYTKMVLDLKDQYFHLYPHVKNNRRLLSLTERD